MRTCPSRTSPRPAPEPAARARRAGARARPGVAALGTLLWALWGPGAARAEVIEEIVARVNDDIITLSQLRERESRVIGELFSRYSGEELDRRVSEARAGLLRDMIRESLLLQRADSLGLDTQKVIEVGIEQIKRQNDIKTNDELLRLLREQGTTLEELREQILRFNVPPIMLDREVRQKVAVTDAEVEAYYGEHKEEFHVPETVSFTEIVLRLGEGAEAEALRERAGSVLAEVAAGAAFEAMVEKHSDSPSRGVGGKVGPLRPEELSRPIERALRALAPGEVSPVIESRYGFHILRLDERSEAKQRDVAEVRESIESKIRDQKTQAETEAYFERLLKENIVRVSAAYRGYGEP